MIIANSALNELRSHVPFTQLRFHCNKQHGRTIHMATAANSAGEAVIQYFTGQTETMPASCGSFVRMKDDDSYLTQYCHMWGKDNDGHFHSATWSHQGMRELYDHPAFIAYSYHWVINPAQSRWECDDFSIAPSSGDFWRVFVRWLPWTAAAGLIRLISGIRIHSAIASWIHNYSIWQRLWQNSWIITGQTHKKLTSIS